MSFGESPRRARVCSKISIDNPLKAWVDNVSFIPRKTLHSNPSTSILAIHSGARGNDDIFSFRHKSKGEIGTLAIVE